MCREEHAQINRARNTPTVTVDIQHQAGAPGPRAAWHRLWDRLLSKDTGEREAEEKSERGNL
ncbi:MAG: hypothetical protein ACLFPU_09910 [Dehalococcoidia bacterium]